MNVQSCPGRIVSFLPSVESLYAMYTLVRLVHTYGMRSCLTLTCSNLITSCDLYELTSVPLYPTMKSSGETTKLAANFDQDRFLWPMVNQINGTFSPIPLLGTSVTPTSSHWISPKVLHPPQMPQSTTYVVKSHPNALRHCPIRTGPVCTMDMQVPR